MGAGLSRPERAMSRYEWGIACGVMLLVSSATAVMQTRLPGLIWLAYVASGRAFDAEFDTDVRAFYKEFYHLDLTDAQLRKLVVQ